MKRFIKINPALFAVIPITYFMGFLEEYFLMFAVLLFHELFHLIAICFEDIKIMYIKIEPFGITIRLRERVFENPKKELVMAIAGPFSNFLLAFILYLFSPISFSYLILANLSMGVFNLLPVCPLDGGRILKAYLTPKYGYIKSYKTVLLLTKVLSVFLIILGIFIIYFTRFNYSVCIIGCFLFFNLLTEKNHSLYYLTKEISEYKKKNKNIEKMPVVSVAVNKNFPVRKILSDLSFTRYYIFTVIENAKIIAKLTEGELIEALIKHGAGIKIKDVI